MRAVVAGAGGFIGGHLVKRLLADGHEVRAVDIKPENDWHQHFTEADSWHQIDLRDATWCFDVTRHADAVFNLAADMGGMGFIETHKLDCMLSTLITTNLLRASAINQVERYFYASSACVYPGYRQDRPDIAALKESDAYPAEPEDGYGWEKLFGERMAHHFAEETEMVTRVGRFHNIYGPQGTWFGGREKAPAAICRKIAEGKRFLIRNMDVWGDGEQTRSFCYVDDAVEGILRLTMSDFPEPLNIGSAEMVSINELVELVEEIAGWKPAIYHDLEAPQGVRGRSSDNTLCREVLGWEPSTSLAAGMMKLYGWIEDQVSMQLGPR